MTTHGDYWHHKASVVMKGPNLCGIIKEFSQDFRINENCNLNSFTWDHLSGFLANYVYTRVCDSVHGGAEVVSVSVLGSLHHKGSLSRGSLSRGSLSRGLCPGGLCLRGWSLSGGLCLGCLCPVGLCPGSLSGGLFTGGHLCLGGVCHEDPPIW